MADDEDMLDEEAEAWAEMREAFADDDEVNEAEEATAHLKQQNTALAFASALLKKTAERFDDDEKVLENLYADVDQTGPDGGASDEAAGKVEEVDSKVLEAAEDQAWAELRAAFGDESLLNAVGGQEDDEEEDVDEDRHRVAVARSTSGMSKEAAKGAMKAVDPEDEIDQVVPGSKAWLQEQVDQLVGESQRMAGTSFTPLLLGKLWSLPLEEQHDVLLGAMGAAAGLFGTQHENAVQLWKIMGEEIDARKGIFHTPAVKEPVDDDEHPRKVKVKRSRSRSVSI